MAHTTRQHLFRMKNYVAIILIVSQLVFNTAYAQVFTSSQLPIVKVNTLGGTLNQSPPIITHISITNNGSGVNLVADPANDLISYAAMNIRGSSSAWFPQKSYAIELRDSANTALDISKTVLGMPAESDWILYGPYTDKTFLRNMLTYSLGEALGEYAPRGKFVELLINGSYEGVYVIFEKIKRDGDRVNISKMDSTNNTVPSVTGGYLLKIDKFTGVFNWGFPSNITSFQGQSQSYFYQGEYPKSLTIPQQTYITSHIDSFENALAGANYKDSLVGYRKYINVPSFINYFISNELSNNVDGYRLSTYLYKKRMTSGDGKIHMGPLWDFNLAYGNADYCDGWYNNVWAYQQPCDQNAIPFWWERLLQDTNYANQLKCKYNTLRTNEISNARIDFLIDSMVNKVGTAATARHYTKWPILGTYVWPNYYVGNTYSEEIDSLKSWMNQRLVWLDANMPGNILPGCFVSPLALHNINLKATSQASDVILSWQIIDNTMLGNYAVERSVDALNFENIGTVSVTDAGTINKFIDEHAYAGNNFYRVKFKNSLNEIKESNIVSAQMAVANNFVLYPSHVHDVVKLQLYSNSMQSAHVQIMDVYGKALYTVNFNLYQGNNNFSIPTQQFPSGVYSLTYTPSATASSITKRFVKFA